MAKANRLRASSCFLAVVLLGGSASLARAEAAHGGQRIFRPHASPTVTITVPNRATISGTGVLRSGSGPAKLGGPAKTTSGINGTSFRPKH